MIRIHSLCKSYRSGTEAPAVILQNVEFQVARGEFAAITGPSGSGKTTLLNIIGALDNDYDGSVAINGQDMRSLNDRRLSEFRNQTVGFVFQHSNLLAPLTARENVLLPGYFARKGENEAALNARADQLLERVGLGAKGHPGAADEVNAEGEADECKPEDSAPSGQAGAGGDTAQPAADSAPAAENENAENEDKASPPAASDSLHTLATTADAPLLSPIVLVVRGDFAARYPETVRRLARAVLAAGTLAADTPLPAARRLLERFPWVTDPRKMLALEPSASLADNKAFFGLSKSPAHPVPYGELFSSMLRVLEVSGAGGAAALDISPEDVFWDGPLKSLSEKALVTAKAASRTAQSADAKAAQTEPAEAAETAEAQGNSASEASPAAASGQDESN